MMTIEQAREEAEHILMGEEGAGNVVEFKLCYPGGAVGARWVAPSLGTFQVEGSKRTLNAADCTRMGIWAADLVYVPKPKNRTIELSY